MSNKTPLVAIRTLVYNHAEFLHDYFRGLIMQKTNFPFIAVIHDDCSTDSSAKIIHEYAEKYPRIIKPIFEKINCYQNGLWDEAERRIQIAYQQAKYIAFCEGDDYWTDPLKLQKQVEYLEGHPKCALCHANAVVLKDGIFYHKEKKFRNDVLEDLLLRDNIFTGTVVVRTKEWIVANAKRQEIFCRENSLPFTDHPNWALLAINHDIYYLNDEVSCYRILSESACHSKDKKKTYNYTAKVALFHQMMFDYCKQYRTFAHDFMNDFYEMLFHLRKRAIREAGLKIGYPQIWEILKLLPYWPMVISRWIKRKINGNK